MAKKTGAKDTDPKDTGAKPETKEPEKPVDPPKDPVPADLPKEDKPEKPAESPKDLTPPPAPSIDLNKVIDLLAADREAERAEKRLDRQLAADRLKAEAEERKAAALRSESFARWMKGLAIAAIIMAVLAGLGLMRGCNALEQKADAVVTNVTTAVTTAADKFGKKLDDFGGKISAGVDRLDGATAKVVDFANKMASQPVQVVLPGGQTVPVPTITTSAAERRAEAMKVSDTDDRPAPKAGQCAKDCDCRGCRKTAPRAAPRKRSSSHRHDSSSSEAPHKCGGGYEVYQDDDGSVTTVDCKGRIVDHKSAPPQQQVQPPPRLSPAMEESVRTEVPMRHISTFWCGCVLDGGALVVRCGRHQMGLCVVPSARPGFDICQNLGREVDPVMGHTHGKSDIGGAILGAAVGGIVGTVIAGAVGGHSGGGSRGGFRGGHRGGGNHGGGARYGGPATPVVSSPTPPRSGGTGGGGSRGGAPGAR